MWNTVAKRYINGEIDIHYHFWVTAAENYCICFQRAEGGGKVLLSESRVRALDSYISDVKNPGDHIEMSMFVNVIEDMQSPEMLKHVMSVIRLHLLNNCLDPAADPVEHGFSVALELIWAEEDREGVAIGRDAFVNKDKLLNQIVESGPEIVQNLTDSDRPLYGDIRGLTAKYPNLMPGLWLNLFGDELTLGFSEDIDLTVQRTQLLIRPIELGVDSIECDHVYSSYGEETKDSENSQGLRDTDSYQGRRIQGSEEGGGANREELRDSQPPGEGLAQTGTSLRSDSSISKHTHSGSLEDA